MRQMNCKKCRNCVLVDQAGKVTCRAFVDDDNKVRTFSRPRACMFFENRRKFEKENKKRFQDFLNDIRDIVDE